MGWPKNIVSNPLRSLLERAPSVITSSSAGLAEFVGRSRFGRGVLIGTVFLVAGWLPVAVGQSNLAIGKPVSASGPVWNSQFVEHLNDGILNNQTHPLASSNTLGFTYELDLLVRGDLL